MKPLPLTLVIIGAMLMGAGITYWTARQMPLSVTQPSVATSSAPLIAPEPPVLEQPSESNGPDVLDEAELNKAIEETKAARARGELKPAANSPEEYARALGALNYQLVTLAVEYPEPPEAGDPRARAYAARVDELTKQYANLTLDEERFAGREDESPKQLAHLQAHLAAGGLELDELSTAKTEAILQRIYEKLFPLIENESGARIDAATQEATAALMEFLSPEQKRRFELMGADQVLFGLSQPEE